MNRRTRPFVGTLALLALLATQAVQAATHTVYITRTLGA